MTRTAGAVVAALFAALFAVLLWVAPAQAHATLVATDPANGAQLSAMPTVVRVTFDEPVVLPPAGGARVLDAQGTRADTGSPRLEAGRTTVVIGLRPGLPPGIYTVSWSVVSADSHPAGGSMQFGYGVPATGTATAAADNAPRTGWELGAAAGKAIVYLGLVVALGLVPAAMVLGADPHERRTLWRAARIGAGTTAAGSLLQLVAQHEWQGGADFGAFAGTAYATAVWLRLTLLAAVPAVLRLPDRLLRVTGGLLAVAVLGTVVRNGHGGAGQWWQFATTLLHVVAVTAWLGGLAALGWLLLRRRISGERLRRLPRWSRYAAGAVAALTVSGLLQALIQVRYPGALLTTAYGLTLTAKLLLVAGAVALGVAGNRWVRRQAAAGGAAAGQTARLRGWVRTEAGLGALIVALSGMLSSITPAEAAYAPELHATITVDPYIVAVDIAPLRRGPQSHRVTITGRAEATPPARSVQLVLSQPGHAGPTPGVRFPYRLPGALRPGEPTPVAFAGGAVTVPSSGAWTGTLTIEASDSRQFTGTFDFRVY
ncbi:copper resistance protein CopC/CopD [Dactylosporangium vinaceum]|uniref:Copper resistance CopC/CopD family protein n=1 Tax=Dactylosporangium vinaceum TaxID=53362 RepID=A0ABV5M341_9ACTN|nr:copper resistance protein CopC [Dactylosporangium vinaceum]UAB99785.1 copper resistance protein CopC/CopD [Dactylosporangium vinaceum]